VADRVVTAIIMLMFLGWFVFIPVDVKRLFNMERRYHNEITGQFLIQKN